MIKRGMAIIFGVLAVALLNAIVSQPQHGEVNEADLSPTVEASSPTETKPLCERPEQTVQAEDVIRSFDRLGHQDYLIETRYKLATLDVPREYGPPPKPVQASYIVVSRKRTIVATFDADIYSPVGNSTNAGFSSLLGKGPDQLIVSQDISKTGVQWVADFSDGFRIIFDGPKFQVGREANDMTISDLDGDGVSEIVVPLTAFYGFERWRLSTMETPLPDIIFKYDSIRKEYRPANPYFRECILKDNDAAAKSAREVEREIGLGRLMSIVLDYVFVGEEQRGWKLFEDMCQLPDKGKIKSDMQKVLKAHPVYRHIYNQRVNR